MKNREQLRNCHRPDIIWGYGNQMQCGTLDWILEQKMGLSGKPGEIQIQSGVFS